jgi:cytochrome c oxidase subunit 2
MTHLRVRSLGPGVETEPVAGRVARLRCGAPVLVACLLSGCGSNGQSALDPHSHQSREIAHLWWGMLAAAVVVFGGTVALIAIAYLRRRRRGLPVVGEDEEVSTGLVVAFGIVIPVVALVALFFIADIGVVRATDAPTRGQTRMTIDVVGHQWFWEVRYPGTKAVTANEIHIPVKTPIKVVVTTADVIHSFWVPELNKKVDTIPGHPNALQLYANRPGFYRGQCAEFCGLQHAHMALAVYADPAAKFRAWLANESRPVAQLPPAFADSQCASCHTIRGTSAQGRIGPDLTHVAGRKTLAALTIPNNRDYLGAWILDPQHFKPGNKMPALRLNGRQFTQLVDFLESLE